MVKTNLIDQLIAHVSTHVKDISKLKPKQIKEIIIELKKEKKVWDKLASGNRNYLDNCLTWDTDKAYRGAIPHLAKALPHRLGFIASKIQKDYTIGDPAFDDIITGKRTLDQLNHMELFRFLEDFVNSKKIKKVMHPGVLDNNYRTVNAWITKYQKNCMEDIRNQDLSLTTAKNYLEVEKKEKILNLFGKTILPKLAGDAARNL